MPPFCFVWLLCNVLFQTVSQLQTQLPSVTKRFLVMYCCTAKRYKALCNACLMQLIPDFQDLEWIQQVVTWPSMYVVGPIVVLFVTFLCSGFKSPLCPLLYFITAIICISLWCFTDEMENPYTDQTYVCNLESELTLSVPNFRRHLSSAFLF